MCFFKTSLCGIKIKAHIRKVCIRIKNIAQYLFCFTETKSKKIKPGKHSKLFVEAISDDFIDHYKK